MADQNEIEVAELIKNVSKGHPGAVSVCCDLFQYGDIGAAALLKLDELNIRRIDVWVLYNVIAEGNLLQMMESLFDGTAIEMLKKDNRSSFYVNPSN